MFETIAKLNSGNWVKNYADYLYNFAFYRVCDEEAVNDLVQDTFLSALENEHTYAGRSSELTWLTVILRNKIIIVKKLQGLTQKPS